MRQRMRFLRANALAQRHGLGYVDGAMVRGGTSHRVDLLMPDGSIAIVHDGQVYKSDYKWARDEGRFTTKKPKEATK